MRSLELDLQTLSPGDQISVIKPSEGWPLVIQLQPAPPRSLLDPAIYAPAIPGILVALVGLYITHRLTQGRERRKEIADLCGQLKTHADQAAIAADTAWRSPVGEGRARAIFELKRKLQTLGVAATYLRKRSRIVIDVTVEVADFRRLTTVDPLEDPDRLPDEARVDVINAGLASFMSSIDSAFTDKYR